MNFNFSDFFDDVKAWMSECNEVAAKYQSGSENFWIWVYVSSSDLVEKYNNHPFAFQQMTVIVNWLKHYTVDYSPLYFEEADLI
ncbi:hypothetical protein KG089_05275 [Carnobacteriaceae bacterium zg-ZUI252]|nr:hypothetical protein [Carnobacteriaceae bacterium zg-ZUI252]